MTKKEQLKETILQLKEVKRERELSCNDIHEMVTKAGFDLSPTTIKRVFAEGSEDIGFRYSETIRPIAQVMLSFEDDTPLSNTEVEALKSIVLLKDTMLSDLNTTVRNLEEKLNDMSARYEDIRESRGVLRDEIAFLREQIKSKDEYIKYLVTKLEVK